MLDIEKNKRFVKIEDKKEQNSSPKRITVNDAAFECLPQMIEILHLYPYVSGSEELDPDYSITIAAFLLYKASLCDDPFSVHFEDLINFGVDRDIFEVASASHIKVYWEDLLKLFNRYPGIVFRAVSGLFNPEHPNITPDDVSILAINLLDIQTSDTVLDLCCGTGYVIEQIKRFYSSISATGYDNDRRCIAVAKVRNDAREEKITYISKDIFDLFCEGKSTPKYNRVFSNYPFGMSLRNLGAGKEYLSKLEKRIPSISKATSSDWLFNMAMTELLSEKGKAVGIMTNGSTWNMIDAPIRQYFVENGLIECVIALPAKLFINSTAQTSMIVFSHGNKGVRLVDASAQFTAGRRTNGLTDEDIDTILQMVETDSDRSIFVETETLRANDYVLNTKRYLVGSDSGEDGVVFGSIIKRITRGAPLNAGQLDQISSSAPTDMQYLMLANIQNGLIDSNLPYLSKIEKKNEKYCLTNHCLILSKNGRPYKVAVVELADCRKILANGNLYIIEVDEEKADPYYLAAFFSSESGSALLESITVGATIPNIGVEQLKKLRIPLPSIEEQKEIAARYQQARDEIKMLQLKLEKARNRMMHVYEEGN